MLVGAPVAPALAVSEPPAKLSEGASFSVRDVGAAGARLFLSKDGRLDLADVRLTAARRTGAAKVNVPASVPAGAYRLLSCIGSRCAASKRTTAVSTAKRDEARPFTPTDGRAVPDDAAVLREAAASTPCAARRGGAVPSYANALRAVQASLDRVAGRSGAARLKRSPALAGGPRAEETAARAVMTNEPGAALQSLLAAIAAEPREPAHLVNAAALLAATGRPLEAIAFVRAAEALEPRPGAPFGVSPQALARNAEGVANLALGRFSEAERQLRAAVALEPLLAEAKTNLGTALRCRKEQEMLRWLRAGRFRQPLRDDVVVGPGSILAGFPAVEIFDLSAGREARLPDFRLGATAQESALLRDTFFALQRANINRTVARNQRRTAAVAAVKFDNPLSRRRANDILLAVGLAASTGEAGELDRALTRGQREILDFQNAWFQPSQAGYLRYIPWQQAARDACAGSDDPRCHTRVLLSHCAGPSESAYGSWRGLMENQLRRLGEFVRIYSRTATGLAANLAEPSLYEATMLQIENEIASRFNGFTAGLAGSWSGAMRGTGCFDDLGPAPPSPGGDRDADVSRATPCSPFLRGVRFGFKIGADAKAGLPFDIAVDVNCEKVSIEIGAKVVGKDNYLGVFGQLDYAPGTGKLTLFGGPKASGRIPGTNIGGSIKDGIFVRFNRDGSVDDAGFRVSATAQGGLDAFTIKGGTSMDFSFAPIY
jgi:tetratricopeptide (TPR) repeat protein